MKKSYILLVLIFGIAITYFLGPKPSAPEIKHLTFTLTDSLAVLEKELLSQELATPGLKKDNEARIVWADSTKKEKTETVLLYLHGFSATQEEGDPVVYNLAKKFNANLYLNRLPEHGVNLGDSTMLHFTAYKAIEGAERALEIAKKLGGNVHIVATSFGGALALYLASKHPEIKSISLYSPCVAVADPKGKLLDNPWGIQIARAVKGGDFNDIIPANPTQSLYWTTHYRLEALVELQNFLTTFMTHETFQNVKCPLFLGYYYKDEDHQDKVVSVPALLKMYEEVASIKKEKIAFPNAANHVLASYVLSKDYKNVETETAKFLDKIINTKRVYNPTEFYYWPRNMDMEGC